MSVQFPREWCASGTKTDPGATVAAAGFVSGTPAASAHMNFELNELALATRRTMALALCKPRLIHGVTLDVASFLGVASRGQGTPAVVATAHSGGTPLVGESDMRLGGVLAAITGNIGGAAWDSNTDQLMVVGNGGNHNCSSVDQGTTWTAGGALGGQGVDLNWMPVTGAHGSRFLAGRTGNIMRSTNGAAWTAAAVAGYTGQGIAMLADTGVYVLTGAGPVTGSLSVDGVNAGITWAAGGVPPNAAAFTNRGTVTGRGLDNIYHAGCRSGTDAKLQVSSSADGVTWTQVAEFDEINGFAYGVNPRILQCPDTGALFLIGSNAAPESQLIIWASTNQGSTWTEPFFMASSALGGFSAAHGRLFMTNGAGLLFATDGRGWT